MFIFLYIKLPNANKGKWLHGFNCKLKIESIRMDTKCRSHACQVRIIYDTVRDVNNDNCERR